MAILLPRPRETPGIRFPRAAAIAANRPWESLHLTTWQGKRPKYGKSWTRRQPGGTAMRFFRNCIQQDGARKKRPREPRSPQGTNTPPNVPLRVLEHGAGHKKVSKRSPGRAEEATTDARRSRYRRGGRIRRWKSPGGAASGRGLCRCVARRRGGAGRTAAG